MIQSNELPLLPDIMAVEKPILQVNLAVDLSREGKQVVLVDLDIVNPYFRSADFKRTFDSNGN